MACVPAASTIVTAPVRAPTAEGVNVTVTAHVPLAAIGLPLTQVLV
jgi:hypothetical protein